MKRRSISAMALALALLLAACGADPVPVTEPEETQAQTTAVPETVSDWQSEGRAYRQSPVNTGADSTSDIFCLGADYYTTAMYFGKDSPSEYVLLKNGTRFYAPEDAAVELACAGDGCLWLTESRRTGDAWQSLLVQLSTEGKVLSELDLGTLGLGETYFSAMGASDEGVWLAGSGKAVLISGGAVAAELTVPAEAEVVCSGTGEVCIAAYNDEGVEVSELGSGGSETRFSLEGADLRVFDGSDEFYLTCATEERLCGLDKTGGATTVIVWADCGTELAEHWMLSPLSGGDFLLKSSMGLSLLTQVEPSELPRGGELTIATLGGSLYDITHLFNMSGSGWMLTETDYTQGGEISAQDALTRLYADIAAGEGPDLLLLDGMPVDSLVRRGYLADIAQLLEGDPDMSADDIVLAGRLGGGTYYLSRGFGIETYAGLKSNFGEAEGWTPEEYLEAERSLAPGAQMMYYVTRESFMHDTALRYMQRAIDWQTGSCGFDNAGFISLLETAGQITEHPETTEFTPYTPPEEELRTGETYVETVHVGCVTAMRDFEERVGQALSFVGMPTPDGSNGSVIDPSQPVGVLAGGEHFDGCVAFLKFLLLSYDLSYGAENNASLPMYRPYLEQLEVDAEADGRMTPEDTARFEAFLASVENTTLCDETALGMICEEAEAYFGGVRTAEETARVIQERLAIYVAEQS